MERSIRIGKDFNVRWSIHGVVDGERQPYELAGKELVLQYRTPYGLKEATEWKTEGNTIVWTFRGKDQKALGSYELILTENGGKDGMVTVDTCRAFKLVAHSCDETDGSGSDIVAQAIMLETEVAFAPLIIQTGGGGGSYDDTELRGMIAEQGERIDELADEVRDLKESGLGYDDTELRQQVSALADEVSSNGVLIEDLQNTKIDKENDDYYPKMAVGLADNLVGVDVVDSEINFRRSGGGAISDGVARIESIKGNSVVWNNMVDTRHLVGKSGWTYKNAGLHLVKGHKYAMLRSKAKDALYCVVKIDGTDLYDYVMREGTYAIIFTSQYDCAASNTLLYSSQESDACQLIDLTKMFQAGNEPTTIEEYNRRKPVIEDENAYNEGEVISMRAEGIKSVGVNAWDEQWELGTFDNDGEEVTTALNNTIRCANPIEILPNTEYYYAIPNVAGGTYMGFAFFYDNEGKYINNAPIAGAAYPKVKTPSNAATMRFDLRPEYGTTYNHDICINISDTAVNGKYYPNIKRVEELSIIRKYFPDGMRSAGTAHDEIRYNKASGKWEKVEAIGTRAYQDGDADNGAYLTDGKTETLYPLAEPIVTELDEADQFKDLDYQVWNCGTEQMVTTESSSPLSAEIVYGFNAPAKIKENANEIAKLKQSSGSTTTYKTINGTSVVGSGNIDTHYPISSSTASALTIQPNTYYKWSGATLNVTLGSTDANLCEFVIELSVTGTPSITFPSSVKWANGIAPTFVSGKTYIVSIVNNLGVYAAF